jgi:hypothetical protein
LGAGSLRIARQLLTENLLLAGGGGFLGIVLAWWSFAFLKQLIPAGLGSAVPLQLDFRVLAFTLVATVATGLLFGLAPVLAAARLDLNQALKDGGAKAGFGGRGRMRNFLVISEVALAVVLLISAALLLRSFVKLRWLDPGFQAKGVLTLQVVLSETKYSDSEKRAEFFEHALEKLRSLPGVHEWLLRAPSPSYGRAAPVASRWKAGPGQQTNFPMTLMIGSSVRTTWT